jgi:hypothetical protein
MQNRRFRPEVTGVPRKAGERRQAERYRPVDDRVWLGWGQAEAFKTSPALLLDVSLRGALVVADEVPKEGTPAWICLQSGTESEWVKGRVLGVMRTWRGPHKVRLVFEGSCPYSFFKAAVYGPDAELPPPAQDDPPKTLHGLDWW